MSLDQPLPQIYLARHGETAWTITHQHTGLTDLPLTARGERNALRLGQRLHGMTFPHVFTSPLQRAAKTCALAGFAAAAQVDGDLLEWNYGAYEGMTTRVIHQSRPGWELFRDGCPNGESAADVGRRADRVITRVRGLNGDTIIFSSSHFLRVLAARWLGLEPAAGRFFLLGTAALSIVGYEHTLHEPLIRLWNDCRHEGD